jgi:LysR family transcriptional activator of glutamate synthase operon
MDLHQLRVFQAAAKNKGFTRAGDQLHLSQSTVSQHIKQLEDELGCPLFLRVGKRVLVTEAGNLLLQYAEKLFHDLKNIEMTLREISAVKRGAVRLGVGATTLTYRLPHVLGRYNRQFPDIELIVQTGTTEFLLDAVRAQNIDLAVVMSPPAPQPGLTIQPLGDEELVFVLNSDHPLAHKSSLTPADVASLRFILFEKHTAMQNLIDGYFDSLSVAPRIAMEVESIEAIKSLVRAGLGASVLPLCAVSDHALALHLKVMRVKNMPLVRQLGLAAVGSVILPNAIRELGKMLVSALAGKERRKA